MTHAPLTSKRGIFAALLLVVLAVVLVLSGAISDLAASGKAERDARLNPSKTAETAPDTVASPDLAKVSGPVEATSTEGAEALVKADEPDLFAVQRGLMGWKYGKSISDVTGAATAYGYVHDTNEVAATNASCIGTVAIAGEYCQDAMKVLSSFVIRFYEGNRLEPFFDTPLYAVKYNEYGMATIAIRWYEKNGKEVVRYYDIGLTDNGKALVPDQNQALSILHFLTVSTSFKVEIQTYQGPQTLDFLVDGFDAKFLLKSKRAKSNAQTTDAKAETVAL